MDRRPCSMFWRPRFRGCQAFGRNERGEPSEIETRSLEGGITEPPRLDRLSGGLEVGDPVFGVSVHDGVLDRNTRDRRVPTIAKERGAFVEFSPHFFAGFAGRGSVEPSDTGVTKARARRVHDGEQIPSVIQMVTDVARYVMVRPILCREKVTRPRIVTQGGEGATDGAGELASDQDPH